MRVLWQGVRTQVMLGSDTRIPSEIIAAAKLPEPIAGAIKSIVEQTKLRRAERCDVAAELCSHFAAGLNEGGAAERLLADFGEPRTTAKLIARAMKRKRGWLYHARRRVLQGVGVVGMVLFVAYAALFLRFHLSKPNVARNYLAEYNARIAAMPQAEVAWPIYHSLLPGWKNIPIAEHKSLESWPKMKPSHPGWALGIEHVQANAEALATIRRAASLPGLGMPLSNTADTEYLAFTGQATKDHSAGALAVSDNPPLLEVLIPAAAVMRNFSRTLAFEAHAAAEAGDGQRAVDNILAMVGIGKQLREPRILILDLVANAIASLGFSTLGELLADRPEVFSEAQLVQLSHGLVSTSESGNPFRVRFEFERNWFDDFLQRMYSDNGKGDGIFVGGGIGGLDLFQDGKVRTAERSLASSFAGPAAAGVMAGRRDVSERYHSMIDRAERGMQRPLWERDDEDFGFLAAPSLLEQIRYQPIYTLTPGFASAASSGELLLQSRDAMLVAIVLELHHRRTGAYPASLSELKPKLLPTVPPDRYTGKPIGYVVKDGKPLLYSVGADRTDDGGVPPPGNQGSYVARQWMSAEQAAHRVRELDTTPARVLGLADFRGDWILWPEPAPDENSSP